MIKWLRKLWREQRGSIGVGGSIFPTALGIPGLRVITLTGINPGALAAVTAVDVDTVNLAVRVGDLVFPISVPPTLEVRLQLQAVSVPSNGTLRLRFINQSAAGATGAALNYNIGWVPLS